MKKKITHSKFLSKIKFNFHNKKKIYKLIKKYKKYKKYKKKFNSIDQIQHTLDKIIINF